MSVFILSIETSEGVSFRHGFHLGTDECEARQIAAERFHGRANWGLPVVTVALIRNDEVFDVYYGNGWHSELFND